VELRYYQTAKIYSRFKYFSFFSAGKLKYISSLIITLVKANNPDLTIKSIIFNKTYPLLDSTKMLKLFIDKYILTFITDTNTDERHHLSLDVYGYNINKCYGGMVSQDRLLVLDSINEIPTKFYYQSENTIINYLDMLHIPIFVS
jgi:hypothetical protein